MAKWGKKKTKCQLSKSGLTMEQLEKQVASLRGEATAWREKTKQLMSTAWLDGYETAKKQAYDEVVCGGSTANLMKAIHEMQPPTEEAKAGDES